MLNENPSEPRPSREPRHPLDTAPQKSPHPLESGEPTGRRGHPLDQPNIAAHMPQQRFAVSFPIVRPYVTYTLIAINCLIFLLGVLSPDVRDAELQFGILFRPAVVEGGEFYRLFTSMFLHADPMHLFFNMYSLFIIGRSIEWVFGWQRYLLIYLLGGLAGSVLFALTLARTGSGLGASGAVFAIWGANLVFLYQHRTQLGNYAMLQLRQIVVFAALNLVIGLTNPNIGTWAHVGGFVGGIVLTWFLGPRLETHQHPEHPNVIVFTGRRYDSWLLPVVIFAVALAGLMVIGMNALL